MDKVHPPLVSSRPTLADGHAKHNIIKTLANGLPDAYELFRGVHRPTVHVGGERHGELDIVVASIAGDLAVPEVKAGKVLLSEEGVFECHGAQIRDGLYQAAGELAAVLHRLCEQELEVRLQHLLVPPHQRVDAARGITFPRERIFDANDCAEIAMDAQPLPTARRSPLPWN